MNYTNSYKSPVGGITMASDGVSLTGLWIDGQKYFEGSLTGGYSEAELPVFESAKRWLDCYFNGKIPDFVPPLRLEGTPFRKAVWEILLDIPYGQLTTYGSIAGELAKRKGLERMSAQAVGGAVGRNPVSIIVPCHRVVGSNGSLTGYAGGINKKIKLLSIEGVDMKKLFVPKKGTAL